MKNQKKLLLIFHKILSQLFKSWKHKKIINSLNVSDNENSKFSTKKWYIIDNKANGNYSKNDEIKFLTRSIESSLYDYSDAYILVTGNINVTGGDANTKVAFKTGAPFKKCRTEIKETFVDDANFINITMPMYNLIEYSDNYSDTSGSLWNFKRDEIEEDDDLTVDNSSPFKYKLNIIGNTDEDEANRKKENVKIVVPLKYLSNFWRSLEMLLINCKVEFSLEWYEECILSTSGTAATFKITDAKLYVPIVTLKTEDNTKLLKLLREGFKRPIYWNKYKIIFKNYNDEYIRERLDANFRGVNKSFVLPYTSGDNITNESSYKNYFLPRVKIENYNIEIYGRNFYDQSINDSIKQYDEIRKISTVQGDDYTSGCLLYFSYFEKNYRLIAADLIKRKALDADSRAIQQIIFAGKTDNQIRVYYILQQSKETILEFPK